MSLDQNTIRWPGSGSLVDITTVPFGFYLNETQSKRIPGVFEYDCEKSAEWAAKRLGYPSVHIEMRDISFYTCFEESVSEYGAQINQFNIRNNMLTLRGLSTKDYPNLTGRNISGTSLPFIVNVAKQYGSEIDVGGRVPLKRVPIQLKKGQQTYDLNELIVCEKECGNRIEIRRVFHGPAPAMARIYDPFSMTGMSYSNVLSEMGFAGYSPATQFLMTPIFEDLLRGQAIDFNDTVRKSGYSFEIANNNLRIFPIPTYDQHIYVEYIVEKDKLESGIGTEGNYDVVSDYSNVPYQNVIYNKLNDVSKQWIRKYYLALCKEVLGAIRQKYSTVPIPGGEVTLDGAELRNEAKEEKEVLVTQLRENLEATTKTALMEAKATEADKIQDTLRKVPLLIYVGSWFFSFIMSIH
jgi:hypothetical protein